MTELPYFDAFADGAELPVETDGRGGVIAARIKKERLAGVSRLRVFEKFTSCPAGTVGYFLCPRNISMEGDFLVAFGEGPDVSYKWSKPVLSLFGIKRPGLCALVRIKRNYKYSFEVKRTAGVWSLAVVFDFTTHDGVYDDVCFEIITLPEGAGYAEMAAAERELRLGRGEITTLEEKSRRAAVDYAGRFPLIRIRMGWKPSPSPVAHQTPETEPDMFVACDFARVSEFARRLKERGVPGAELQLVGWNRSGHDGRFPQLFPADPRLGGDKGLRETIEYVKSLGYRISLHTNLIDSYEIADCFSFGDVAVDRKGEYVQVGHYGGGDSYHVCPAVQMKNCEKDLERLASLGPDGLHFCDVISIVEPDDCHSPDHPCTTGEGVGRVCDIMDRFRERLGGFSSEGTMDFALGHIDYGLYVSFGDGFGKKPVPVADTFLPFFEMIYHGIILYNPLSPTVNYPIKTPRERLFAILRGGRPSFYVYSKFRTGGQMNWMGEVDLTTGSDKEIDASCEAIAKGLRDYRESGLERLRFGYMTNYTVQKSGLEYAEYSDGTVIAGNFGDAPATFRGEEIAAGEWRSYAPEARMKK